METKYHKTSTPTLAMEMRILARDIISEDGITNASVLEAAERLEELDGMTRWNKIDYRSPETFPEKGRNILLIINGVLQFIMFKFYISDDEFIFEPMLDDVDPLIIKTDNPYKPTHWIYAPEFKP